MSADQPGTRAMSMAAVGRDLKELVKEISCERARIVVEENGTPVAALISARDLERLRQWEQQREANFAVIDRMRQAFKGVPDDELEAAITNGIATAREELRREQQSARQP